MDEVTSILIAVGAMIAGLLFLGWACGDFSRSKSTSAPSTAPPAKRS